MLILLPALMALAQPAPEQEPMRVGPGVTAPSLAKKTEPEYSQEALDAGITGAVVLDVVVSATGLPSRLRVLRPLGFGLDERALAAVAKWRFKPGQHAGAPVPVRATIEVNFRLMGGNPVREHRRQQLNAAIALLNEKTTDAAVRRQAARRILTLAADRYPAAMFAVAAWKLGAAGAPDEIGPDEPGGVALLDRAANAGFGPALYGVALRRTEGQGMAADPKRGMEQMHLAARRGSVQAQRYLAPRYEEGTDGFAVDKSKAEFLYRQCAYSGFAECQYGLGRLLLLLADTPDRDIVSAVAWLELAAAGGVAPARAPAAKARAALTAEERVAVDKLKIQVLQQ